jgi:hypothetical protein
MSIKRLRFRVWWKWTNFIDRAADVLTGDWKEAVSDDSREIYDFAFWSFHSLFDAFIEWATTTGNTRMLEFAIRLKEEGYGKELVNAKPRTLSYYHRKSWKNLIQNCQWYEFHLAQNDDRAEDAIEWLDIMYMHLKRDFVDNQDEPNR